MRVICVNLDYNDTCISDISIGKSYEVIESTMISETRSGFERYVTRYYSLYTIINDKGNEIRYHEKLFMKLETWRENQIKSIL